MRLWICATRRLASGNDGKLLQGRRCPSCPHAPESRSKRLAGLQGDPIRHLALAGPLPFVKPSARTRQRFVRKACRKKGLLATVSARALITGVTSRQSDHSGRKPHTLTVMT